MFSYRDRRAAAWLIALWLVQAGPRILSGQALFWGDLLYLHHPWRALVAQQLEGGLFPHWNPYGYLGMPLAANLHSAVLYPGSLVFYFFPFPSALELCYLLHFFLTGFLAFLWLRKWGLRRFPSLAGAALWVLGGVWVGDAQFPHQLSTWAYLPAFLLFSRHAALLGLSFALAFTSGYPLMAAGGALGCWVLATLLGGPGPGRLRPWLAAGLLASVATAPLLFPALELTGLSHRGIGVELEEALLLSFAPRDLAQLVSPLLVGRGEFSPTFLWWKTAYFGLVAWVGVALGFRAISKGKALGLGVYLGACVLFMLGGSTPVSSWLWGHLAPLQYMRYPGNLSYLLLPALSILAAAGFNRRRWAPWFFILLCGELSLYGWGALPTAARDYLVRPGELARRLQAELAGHRYLLSPLALHHSRGHGPDRSAALEDFRDRLYGLSNFPYRIAAVTNFGDPLAPERNWRWMDLVQSQSDLVRVEELMFWSDAKFLLAPGRLNSPGLQYAGEVKWHLHRLKAPVAGGYLLSQGEAARLPAGLPEGRLARPRVPVEVLRDRPDRFRAELMASSPKGFFLSEPRYPGWRFFLSPSETSPRTAVPRDVSGAPRDAGPAPLRPPDTVLEVRAHPALEVFQRLWIPEGRWGLTARYLPGSFFLGLGVAILFLVGMANTWYNRLLRRR